MILILGKNVNNNLKIGSILKDFYGFGFYMSIVLLNDLNISKNCRIKDLDQNMSIKIQKWVEKFKIDIGDALKRKQIFNIHKLKLNKCYRGFRHIYNLPSRGQRTRSNSVTNKKLFFYVNKIKKFD